MPEEVRTVQEKIWTVRKQLADLDEKKAVLTSLLKKLEHQCEKSPAQEVAEAKTTYGTQSTITDGNVTLFRSLFRGREDVFPKRWESLTGKSGYSPACKNEWIPGVCPKPKVKCADCEHRVFVPLTDEIIRQHLEGQMTIGIYPMLKDERCYFLTVDFDKKSWLDDVAALVETCKRKDIACAVERSRSGNGAHVWFFFESALPACLARRFGCALLTKTMERRHQIGLDSYDRFFPSQDTMPQGNFGNLIALPIQPEPAREGNSVFVDSDFNPHPDQWAFLKSIKKLPDRLVWSIEEDAKKRGQIIGVRMSLYDDTGEQPWNIPPSGRKQHRPIPGPLPSKIEVVSSNLLYMEKDPLPSALINRIIRIAAFQNSDFYQAQAMRLSTFGKPRIISCAEEFERHIAIPRGCYEDLSALMDDLGITFSLIDKRFSGTSISVSFKGKLLPEQEESVNALLAHENGVISAPGAFGKTVVAAKLIAERKVNTLLLIHRKQLLDQWRARLAMFLDMAPESIGQIGGGKKKILGIVDVAMLQSLNRKGSVNNLVADYGHVIVDECHHVSAFTFEQVIKQTRAKFVTGLTATPIRKDGHHPIIFMQCGPIRYTVSPKITAKQRKFKHRVIPRQTNTELLVPETEARIHDVYNALIHDHSRTKMIIADVREVLRHKGFPIILTERKEHLELLANELAAITDKVIILHGGIGNKQRREVMEELATVPENETRILLATGKYIGEGFDNCRLDTLFLTMPISWRGTLQQYAGRLHRAYHTKTEVVIYDYVDVKISIARRMFERRKKGYAALGYHLEELSQTKKNSPVQCILKF